MERKAKGQVVGDKVSPAARHTGVSTVASQKGMEIKGQGKNMNTAHLFQSVLQ